MKKKILYLALGLVLPLSLTACGLLGGPTGDDSKKTPSENHVHVWDNGTVEKEPTCTVDGSKLFTCSECSETKTESIPAKGHTEEIVKGTPSTCTVKGLTDGKVCSVCDEVIVAQKPAILANHTLENNVCTVCGYETYTVGLQFELNDGGNDYTVVGYTGTVKSVVVPSKYEGKPVIAIKNEAFKECEFEEIKLPVTIEEIGAGAFQDCKKLKNIIIPEKVEIIKDNTFNGCKDLESVTIEGNIRGIGEEAFYFCEELYSITLPDSCEEIGAEAFRVCSSLSNLTLPKNLRYLGGYSLSQTSITTITIPATVNTIEGGTFSQCKSLQNVTISEGVKKIEQYAFHSCSLLKKIVIPATITEIEPYLFAYTEVLESIEVAEGNTVYDSRNNCKAIIETATNTLIAGCGRTFIPTTVTAIGEAAFFGIRNLSGISIPTSVTEIGKSAFSQCTDLTSFIVPESITYIPDGMLAGCQHLTEINVKGNVTGIGKDAFKGTIYLRKLVLPASIAIIGEGAFTNMSTSKDMKIYFRGTGYQWSKITNIDKPEFSNFTNNGHVVYNYDGE